MITFSWIVQIILISIILIILIHHTIIYLKDSLTVPKVKDMIHAPSKQYEEMHKIIQNEMKLNDEMNPKYEMKNEMNQKDEMKNEMKNELKNYLKKQMSSSDTEPSNPESFSFTDVSSLPISTI